MSDFIMDEKRGKTQYTIGKVKSETVIFPSSSIVALPPSERFNGSGGALAASNIFNITGANAAQSQTINTDGLYHIMVNILGPTPYGQPKYIYIDIKNFLNYVGSAYYSNNSTHSLFIELKKGDLVKFGTPMSYYNYTMYPTYIQLGWWLIRRVAPIGGI